MVLLIRAQVVYRSASSPNYVPNLWLPPKEEATKAQPSLIEDTDNIGPFENAEQGYKIDVVDLKFGSVRQHGILSFGQVNKHSET